MSFASSQVGLFFMDLLNNFQHVLVMFFYPWSCQEIWAELKTSLSTVIDNVHELSVQLKKSECVPWINTSKISKSCDQSNSYWKLWLSKACSKPVVVPRGDGSGLTTSRLSARACRSVPGFYLTAPHIARGIIAAVRYIEMQFEGMQCTPRNIMDSRPCTAIKIQLQVVRRSTAHLLLNFTPSTISCCIYTSCIDTSVAK